jgi:glyoxylase-like metal-dependent hydrolase (beta-lactamase superfamily II)
MGAQAVYGAEEMQRSYGTLQPVPAERVRSTADGEVLELGGRPLRFAHTPGHARHHHCLWDEASRGWFTGDTFGLSYREHDTDGGAWILPTSTPVQFEPEPLKRSIQGLLDRHPEAMYLTHYGRVNDVPRLAALLVEQIDAMVEAGLRLRQAPDRHEALKAALAAIYGAQLVRHGVADPAAAVSLLELDIELNAQGLGVWLDRDDER